MIDGYHGELPPIENQQESDHMWRLALHRMDLRKFVVVEEADEKNIKGETEDEDEDEVSPRSVQLALSAPDQDLQELIGHNSLETRKTTKALASFMWAIKVFKQEEADLYAPAQWRSEFEEARNYYASLSDSEIGAFDVIRSIPGYVAAICTRDHWDELSVNEQHWCMERICSEIERDCNNWNELLRVQRFEMSPDRPAALVLPLLFAKTLESAQKDRIYLSLILSLTHPSEEVSQYAALGIATYLWSIDKALVFRCVNILATRAILLQSEFEKERDSELPYAQRRQLSQIEPEIVALVRTRFFESGFVKDDAFLTMEIDGVFRAKSFYQILFILSKAPSEISAIKSFKRLSTALVEWWDDDPRSTRSNSERNYSLEFEFSELLASFVLRVSSIEASEILFPVLEAVNHHPEEVSRIIRKIVKNEDLDPNTAQFWFIWELFATKVREASWLPYVDNEYHYDTEMISVIFLGLHWKDIVHHWKSLDGYSHLIQKLFQDLPPSGAVLDCYVKFLHSIGRQSLPEAFVDVANKVNEAPQILNAKNTVYLLEVLLGLFVYRRPLQVKQQEAIKNAVLVLLDFLVEHGSSEAFKMRDDFVTPLSNS